MQQLFQKQAWLKRSNAVPQAHDESLGIVLIFGVLIALVGVGLGVALSAKANLFAFGALAAALVVLTIRAPIYTVCLAASTDLTCYYISGLTKFPPKVYLISLVALFSIPKFIILVRTSPFVRKIVGLAVAFLVLRLIVDVYWGGAPFETLRTAIARNLSPILIFLCCAAHANSRKNLTLLLSALFAATTLSALFGILQFHGVSSAWDVHYWLKSFAKGEPLEEATNYFSLAVFGKLLRPTGLANTTIEFSYHLVTAIGFAFPIIVLTAINKKTRLFLGVMLAVIMVATIESLTRSAITGMIIIISVTFWQKNKLVNHSNLNRTNRTPWVVVFLLFATLLWSITTLGPSVEAQRIYSYEDTTRMSLYLGTLHLIRIYPLGIGGGNREQIALEHQADLMSVPDPTAIMVLAPHNGFLLAALNWGLPALAISLLFFHAIFAESKRLRKRNYELPPWLSNLGLVLPIFLSGYFVSMVTHNSSPLNGDMVFWYYLGCFAGITSSLKLAKTQGATRENNKASRNSRKPKLPLPTKILR